MNKFAILIFLASLMSVPAVQAADEEVHAAHHPDAAQGQPAPADDEAPGKGMGKMQEKMKQMQELMAKIHSTKDPQERQKLMEEHMRSMQDGMKAMKGMGGMKMGMMGGKKGAGMDRKDDAEHTGGGMGEEPESAGNSEKGAMKCKMMEDGKPGGMMKMHKMMEGRMDMMQKMMDQLLQHEQAEQEMERGG